MEKKFDISKIILQEYLDKFLENRKLSHPNNMMLYSYQMNQDEFNDLKNKLKYLCQQYNIVDLLKNKYFSRCFVLYASEWWKREYNGGIWSWEPIFSTISKNELKNNCISIRSKAIINAFKYWKKNTTFDSGKKFLGVIITNGGLPSKFIQQTGNEYSPIVRVLRNVLKFATEYNASSSELLIYTKEISKKLPETIRKNEIYELITDLITNIIRLKSDYNLYEIQNPIQYLNENYPNWKDQFPLLLEDATIEKILNNFVEEASKAKNINVKGKIPSVDRIFDLSESDELKFLFKFPEINVDAIYFSKFFNIQNIDELPETFYINNFDNNNTIVAIVTRQLGSRKKYKIRSFNNNLNILNSITISLSSANNKIHSKYITIAESLDIEQPLIFTKSEDDILILKGTGSISLEENECYIAYKEDLFDFKEFGEFERTVKVDNNDLILLKCSSDISIDGLNIKLNCQNFSHNKYRLDGDIILYKTIPHISYKGIPKVIYYNKDGNRMEVAQKYIKYYYKGTKIPIFNIQNFSGNLDINFNYECIDKTFTITVFPTNFNVYFESFETDRGYIKFNNVDNVKIEPIIDDNLKNNLKATEINKNEFQFQSLDFKPDKICFKLFWQNNKESLIYVPYPYFGVSFFDENGNCIDSRSISVENLIGKKIKVYNTLKKSTKCKLNFILEKSNSSIEKLITFRCVFTTGLITEIKLINFEQNIKNLLNYSDNENDVVKISVEMGSKEVGSINVSRYDTSFVVGDNCIFLPNEQSVLYSNEKLKNTNIYAINLIDQDALPIQLIQKKSDDTYLGCWNIENLDLENNIYMIISDKKSYIFIKPLILFKDSNLTNLSLFYKKIIEDYMEMDNSLISTDEKSNQKNDFEKFLINKTDKYTKQIWEDIDNLKQIFTKYDIPFTSLKIWKILSSNEYLLCRLLLYYSSDRLTLQKIKDDLNVVTATISFSIWKISLTKYLSYLYEQFLETDIDPQEIAIILENSISNKIKFLTETFPEIETIIYYLLCEMNEKFDYDIIKFNEIAPHICKIDNSLPTKELSDNIFIKNKYNEDNELVERCWVQMLQIQNSLTDGNWIYLPFKHVYNYLKSNYLEELNKLSNFLFELNRFSDFIKNVVNFPQACAFYAFYGGQMNEKIKFFINDFMNFNQNYFIEVYKIAISIILKITIENNNK